MHVYIWEHTSACTENLIMYTGKMSLDGGMISMVIRFHHGSLSTDWTSKVNAHVQCGDVTASIFKPQIFLRYSPLVCLFSAMLNARVCWLKDVLTNIGQPFLVNCSKSSGPMLSSTVVKAGSERSHWSLLCFLIMHGTYDAFYSPWALWTPIQVLFSS